MMLVLRSIIFLIILCTDVRSVFNLSSFVDESILSVESDWTPFIEVNPHERVRRNAEINSNITVKENHLNATQQQLIVHWVGEGSKIIICLAREPFNVGLNRTRQRASVFYSYDYGDTFIDKSSLFMVNGLVAPLDNYYINTKFGSRTIFTDTVNRIIFVTEDNGLTVVAYNVSFVPSEITVHPTQPRVFLAHDKVNATKNLWVTHDFGKTWSLLQMFVKSYNWFPFGDSDDRDLIIERIEPDGASVILKLSKFSSGSHSASSGLADSLLQYVNKIVVVDEFIFASKNLTRDVTVSQPSIDVYVKCKTGSFLKATFSTDLPRYEFYIPDITDNRILAAVVHSNNLCNLYVSDFVDEFNKDVHFTLALERIFCYFPNVTWKNSFISISSETTFVDLHKVQGLRGIYIASQVHPNLGNSSFITPEYLITKISFDWGVRWRDLNLIHQLTGPPCKLENDCSLHLTQKFALWYPSTRLVPIMSSDTAPGLIIATGIAGKSMKGHPAVYMSRDAGVTWKQVLKESYFFNMGDHGSIIVAAPLSKSKDGSTNITYSIDEGETWQTTKISSERLRIYSLMTEPGKNTTIFSLFGSLGGIHKWLIIKLDFRNVFAYNCTDEDYTFKPWSPFNPEDKKMNCLMGQTEVYKRRIAHANCYNGLNFDRPVKLQPCECDLADFMCDEGFIWDELTQHCVRNKNHSVDHYAVPNYCTPYKTYSRTKGYKKIPGDKCMNGAREYLPDILPCPIREVKEFLLLAQKERILMFKLSDLSSEILPLENLQNVIAIEFDFHNNCLFYADIVSDIISKWCLSSGNASKVLVDNHLHSVEGMSFDWISKHLYFVDGILGRIEVVRTDIEEGNRFRRTIINSTIAKKPRGIAVHPIEGYLFWTDWVAGNPSISRAALDGSNPIKLFTKPLVEWPNGISIDFIAERIYWVDAKEDYIASSDLHGRRFKKIIEHDQKVSHPFSVAVFKDTMFWDDWRSNAIFAADKDNGSNIRIIGSSLPGLMDLKVFAHSIQEGTNGCVNNTCSHMCFGLPGGNFSCQCPDDLILVNDTTCVCPGGFELLKNGSCPSVQNTCSSNFFMCQNGNCIPGALKCDGDDDCNDGSDEKCDNNITTYCPSNFFKCGNGKCIPSYWVCDYDYDCSDQLDEKDCQYPACKSSQFSCDNGRCISLKWRCDGENDCRDRSDERNCTQPSQTRTCQADEFSCATKTCIPSRWQCDAEKDCLDGTDEANCTDISCENWQFSCKNHKCIYAAWRCDGDNDCDDNSDELNCTSIVTELVPITPVLVSNSCLNWMFQCDNKRCVPHWWKCDQINDCGDNSDEMGCPYEATKRLSTVVPATMTTSGGCATGEFQCLNGQCIPYSWVCDGMRDCAQGDDEKEKDCSDYQSTRCRSNEFKCYRSGICLSLHQRCDGITHCADGSDEIFCNYTTSILFQECPRGYFQCDGNRCHPLQTKCDGRTDCYDESDEANCTVLSKRIYQTSSLGAGRISQTSLFVTWHVLPDVGDHKSLQFIPSIYINNAWKNESVVNTTFYTFKDLSPGTKYDIVVYVKNGTTEEIFPAAYNASFTTVLGKPSPPQNVTVKILNNTAVEVNWLPAISHNTNLSWYTVHLSPPVPPAKKIVLGSLTSTIFRFPFDPVTHSVWVTTSNNLFESDSSKLQTFTIQPNSTILSDLTVDEVTEYSISLKWKSLWMNSLVKIMCRSTSLKYPSIKPKTTTDTTFTFSGLSPAVSYVFEVVPANLDELDNAVTISATTAGSPFPSVSQFRSTLFKNIVDFHWKPVNNTKKYQYAVYLGTTMTEILDGPKKVVNDTNCRIENLNYCTSYLANIGVFLRESYGPLASPPISFHTSMDSKMPPANVRVSLDGPTTIKIKWQHPCPFADQPIGYILNVKEIPMNISSQIEVPKTRENSLMKLFNGSLGVYYNISVVTTEEGAIPSNVISIKTAPIPPPKQVIVHPVENGGFIVKWESDKNIKVNNFNYQVQVCEGNIIDLNQCSVYLSNNSSLWIQDLKYDKIYKIGVRVVTTNGLKSELSTPALLNLTQGKSDESSSSFEWRIIVVVLIIVGVAGFAYGKRKRSHVNFKNLAHSHYNSRLGSTTFSGVNGLDMEYTPDIRENFSDDEPLVIA